MVLMLYTHPEHDDLLQRPQVIQTEPHVPLTDYFDCFGNRCARLVGGQAPLNLPRHRAGQGEPEPSIEGKILHPAAEDLPPEAVQFLLAIRY
jgi:hypothetical protein